MMKYFIILNGKREGGFTEAELLEKGIDAQTLVWHEGLDNWQEAGTIPELKGKILPPMPKAKAIEPPAIPQPIKATSPKIPPSTPNGVKKPTEFKSAYKIGAIVVIAGTLLIAAIWAIISNNNAEAEALKNAQIQAKNAAETEALKKSQMQVEMSRLKDINDNYAREEEVERQNIVFRKKIEEERRAEEKRLRRKMLDETCSY